MKTEYLGNIVVPDGYSGDTCTLFLCYDCESKKTLSVHPGGYFTCGIPDAQNKDEAIQLILSHPSCENMLSHSF